MIEDEEREMGGRRREGERTGKKGRGVGMRGGIHSLCYLTNLAKFVIRMYIKKISKEHKEPALACKY